MRKASEERRGVKRCRVIYRLAAYEYLSESPLGRLKDISPDGLRVVGERQVAPDTELRLWIEVPHWRNGKKEKVLVQGRSIWCRNLPAERSRYYESGFRLTQVMPEAAGRLRALMSAPQCGETLAVSRAKNWSHLLDTYGLRERRESSLPLGANPFRNGSGRLTKGEADAKVGDTSDPNATRK